MDSAEILPKSWVKTDLASLFKIVGGGTPSTTKSEYWGEGAPWVTSADIQGPREITVKRFVTPTGIQESATNQVPGGTLLVATRVGLGKTAIASGPICFSQDLQGLVPRCDLIVPAYSLYYLGFALQRLRFEGRGTTISGITKKQLGDVQFPLAPYEEQLRISTQIDKLFSELDKGTEALRTARAKLRIYRQAVLKHAFEGKLTADWREKNQDKLESTERLLARIKQEREARYKHLLEEWKLSLAAWHKGGKQGRKPKKPLKPKQLSSLKAGDLSRLGQLPSAWRWARIGEIGLVGTGVTPLRSKSEYYLDGDIAWVTSGALNDPYVSHPTAWVTTAALNDTNLRIYPPHTLVVALYGEGKTRGKCSELLVHAATNQAIAAIVQEGAAANHRGFLKWYLLKNYEEVRSRSSGGVQPNLNLGIVENTTIPLCSAAEAQEIAKRIEQKFSQIEILEDEITAGLQRSDVLRQSVLKKAFSGQLVPQDPEEEPASVLLDQFKTKSEQRVTNGSSNTLKSRSAAT